MKKISIFVFMILVSSCAVDSTKKQNYEEKKLISSISDKYVGIQQNNSYQWLGIPYAEPPQGSLRWKAPRKLESQKKQIKALKFSEPCPQVPSISLDRGGKGEYTGSEDCLYLNIFAPKNLNPEKKLPVMFWIHGGGNTSGEAGSYDFRNLHLLMN